MAEIGVVVAMLRVAQPQRTALLAEFSASLEAGVRGAPGVYPDWVYEARDAIRRQNENPPGYLGDLLAALGWQGGTALSAVKRLVATTGDREMPCPTCNQAMQGIGHTHARNIVEAMLRECKSPNAQRQTSMDAQEMIEGTLMAVLDRMSESNARDFWCPNCGTTRTVTGDHNSDQPPRVVEMAKAIDGFRTELSGPKSGLPYVAFAPSQWAEIRRCIGRSGL